MEGITAESDPALTGQLHRHTLSGKATRRGSNSLLSSPLNSGLLKGTAAPGRELTRRALQIKPSCPWGVLSSTWCGACTNQAVGWEEPFCSLISQKNAGGKSDGRQIRHPSLPRALQMLSAARQHGRDRPRAAVTCGLHRNLVPALLSARCHV